MPKWGQCIWVHNDSGSKLDRHALEARWVGYDEDSTHAHRVYWPETHHVSVEHNIRFTSDSVTVPIPTPPQLPAETPTSTTEHPVMQHPGATDSGEDEIEVEDELANQTPAPAAMPTHASASGRPPPRAQAVQPMRQSMHVQKPSSLVRRIEAGEGTTDGHLSTHTDVTLLTSMPTQSDPEWAYCADFNDIIAATLQDIEGDPKSVGEAQSRPDWPHWKAVMDREMESLERSETWCTILRLTSRNIVSCKWVFRLKRKADGNIDKYKARLVARGFTQVFGTDYYDTYSLVA
jgi:hypothetical protein